MASELSRKLLTDEIGRRLVLEVFVFGASVSAALLLLVEPFLLSRFPSVFHAPSSAQPPGRQWRLPTTRVGWVLTGIGASALGSFLYYRLYHTQLGADVVDRFRTL